jgi:hypothetical protein
LADNGFNWIDYKTKALITMGSWGLMGHIEGRARKPALYAIVNGVPVVADGKTAVTEEQLEAREKHINDFEMKEYLAHHIVINSVSITLTQSIRWLTSAKDMWDAIVNKCEGKTFLYPLYQVNVHCHLQDMKCLEGEDVKAHLSKMWRRREELAGMGAVIMNEDFIAMMIGSLPESFWPLLSSLMITAKATKAVLAPNDLKQYLLEEYEHCLICEQAVKADHTMVLKASGKKGNWKQSKQSLCRTAHLQAACF